MQGIYSASVTPYDSQGSISIPVLHRLMERNLEEGASGFFIGGSSGECFLLTEAERITVFEGASAFKDRTSLVAHVGAVSTGEAIRYAKAAKDLGFHHISSTPPFYYGFSFKQIAGYFYDIAESVEMPLMIYNFPGNTGKELNLDDPNIRALLCSGAVFAVKHTNLNLFQLERIKSLNPDLVLMNGYDETTLAGLSLGINGSIGSTFNVMLPHFRRLYEAYGENNREKARTLQTKANNIMEALCRVGLISGIKYLLECQGIPAGLPRKPFQPLTGEQKALVDQTVAENLVV